MANAHTMAIYYALKRTNPLAARHYLWGADYRERINKAVVIAPSVAKEVIEEPNSNS